MREEAIVEVLNDLVPRVRIQYAAQTLTGDQFRDGWNSAGTWPNEFTLGRLERPAGFDRLVEVLTPPLESLVEARDGTAYVCPNFHLVVAGQGSEAMPIADLAESVLLSAVLITPPETVARLVRWIGGEPIRFACIAVLAGFNLEHDLTVADGVAIRRLPDTPGELSSVGAPPALSTRWRIFDTGPNPLCGEPALWIECEAPAFFHPSVSDERRKRFEYANPDVARALPTEALSLSCNSAVEVVCAWRVFPTDVQSFSPWRLSLPPWPDRRLRVGLPTLSQDMLSRAVEIGRKLSCYGPHNPGLMNAIHRWIRSKEGSSVDRFIDLRIAFESLYAGKDEQGEVSYRVRTRCARHLKESLSDRKDLSRKVGRFYGTASGFVHGRPLDKRKARELRDQLTEADGICRQALLRNIEDENCQGPDVEELSLG